jgi:hypothetical protein
MKVEEFAIKIDDDYKISPDEFECGEFINAIGGGVLFLSILLNTINKCIACAIFGLIFLIIILIRLKLLFYCH